MWEGEQTYRLSATQPSVESTVQPGSLKLKSGPVFENIAGSA